MVTEELAHFFEVVEFMAIKLAVVLYYSFIFVSFFVFLATLGLCCHSGVLCCGMWAPLGVCAGSVVGAHRLSCRVECGISASNQGLNLHPLHCKADS